MTIKEAQEEIRRLQKEYDEEKRQLREKYTSAQIGSKLRKLRKKYGVSGPKNSVWDSSGVHCLWKIDDVVTVTDVVKDEKEVDGIFGKRTKKVWNVSVPGLTFTAGYHSGAGRLKKGQPIRISGKFRFGIEHEYEGSGSYMEVRELLPFKTKIWKC